MSMWDQINLVDAANSLQSEMLLFHDHAMVLLVGIFSFVSILGVSLITNQFTSRTVLEAQRLETIWTILPAILLLWLALPSLRLLYLLDETSNDVKMILKATGHQWYWSYENSISEIYSNDSYMTQDSDLMEGEYRLLEVDNRTVVPYELNSLVITTSADVLHAFAMPSLGMKMDAVPGRMNTMSMYINQPGVYYGQCSEICGANHSFMPIVLEAVDISD
nr:cytochrome c oxidase subunit II [Runcina aurata]